ncbi:MAG: PEP-CTERM sorting domain-containing protein, partial [bacterium]|nr:PEP-CTERM sorting domain-containing protein [bacterium]
MYTGNAVNDAGADSSVPGQLPNYWDSSPVVNTVFAQWSAVPEPSTALLIVLGLAAGCVVRRPAR